MKVEIEEFLEILEDVFEKEISEMNINDNFKNYEEWDSLALLSLIATVNDEYDIILSNSDIDSFNTIGDILNKINKS